MVQYIQEKAGDTYEKNLAYPARREYCQCRRTDAGPCGYPVVGKGASAGPGAGSCHTVGSRFNRYVSFLRAQQTAMPTIGRFPQAHTGIWDCIHEFVYLAPATCVGTTFAQRHPRVIAYWRKLDPDYIDGEGAESYRQLMERIQTTISLLQRRPEQFILLFTHAQFIRNFLLAYEHPQWTAEQCMASFRRSDPVRNGQIIEISM